MPRTASDFSSIDIGETKNFSYGFGPQGQPKRPLAAGEIITSVTFQILLLSGIDPTPAACLIGSPVVQVDGITVTQKVVGRVAGAIYLLAATAATNVPGSQALIAYSHFQCNPIT
jgi:hypothetical protein